MRLFRFTLIIFRKSPRLFMINILFLLLAGLMDTVVTLSLSPIADSFFDPQLQEPSRATSYFLSFFNFLGLSSSTPFFVGFFFFCMFLKAAVQIFTHYLGRWLKYRILGHILLRNYTSFFSNGLSFFSQIRQGVLLNSFSHESERLSQSIEGVLVLIAHTIRFLCLIAVPFALSWNLSLIAIALVLITSWPILFINRLSYKIGLKRVSINNRLYSHIQETLGSVKKVFSFSHQKKEIQNYGKNYQRHRKLSSMAEMISFSLGSVYEFITLSVFFSTIYIGFYYYEYKLTDLLIILYAFRSSVPCIIVVLRTGSGLFNSISSYDEMVRLEKKSRATFIPNGTLDFAELKESIEVKDLGFHYAQEKNSILHGINLKILKNQMTAIVGPSGSGKSTLVDLIMRLYLPTKGEILVDGQNLKDLEIASYRKKIGYISQNPVLFNTSIRENLLWAYEEASEKEMIEALKFSFLWEQVKKFPDGLDTVVGDQGQSLSGGERQRVALAQIVLKKPEILILDEATSALDAKSEKWIQNAIHELAKKCTVVVIAHRLSTIKNAQKIYVLKDGKISGQGNFEKLLKEEKVFQELVQSQLI